MSDTFLLISLMCNLLFLLMKKEILKILIKVLIYALGLIASYLGISALSSCSSSRAVQVHGRGVVLIQDTTFIDHSSDYFRNYKYRY